MLKNAIIGLAALAATLLPQTAAAGAIEAVWEISLTHERVPGTRETQPVSIPTAHRMTTTFQDYASRRYDYGDHYSTYYGTTAENSFDRPLTNYVLDNPFDPARPAEYVKIGTKLLQSGNGYSAFLEIGSDAYSEKVIDGENIIWWHSEYVTLYPQSTVTEKHPSTATLWELLNSFKDSPEQFTAWYSGGSGIVRESDVHYFDGKSWWGNVRLVSLKRIADPAEVPEPSTMALLGAGLLSAAFLRRKRA